MLFDHYFTQLGHGIRSVGKRQQKRNFRCVNPRRPGFRKHFAQGEITAPPCHGTVGIVKENYVHTRRGQQFGLFTQHPPVSHIVIAVYGFVPVIGAGLIIVPDGIIVIVLNVGILLHQFGDVDCPVLRVFHMPGPEEQTHVFVWARGARFGGACGDIIAVPAVEGEGKRTGIIAAVAKKKTAYRKIRCLKNCY